MLSSEDPAELNRNNSFENFREIGSTTRAFADDRVIKLTSKNPLFYLEELNTEFLSENFDIEVFKIVDDDFQKLYFQTKKPQIIDGKMISAVPISDNKNVNTDSVEYYFSILKDYEVDSKIVCKYVNQFNTENYLIDLDHDCTDVDGEDLYFDIYGKVTESEICPD